MSDSDFKYSVALVSKLKEAVYSSFSSKAILLLSDSAIWCRFLTLLRNQSPITVQNTTQKNPHCFSLLLFPKPLHFNFDNISQHIKNNELIATPRTA